MFHYNFHYSVIDIDIITKFLTVSFFSKGVKHLPMFLFCETIYVLLSDSAGGC